MISVISNSLNVKYHKFTQSGCKDIGISNIEFVTKLNSFERFFKLDITSNNSSFKKRDMLDSTRYPLHIHQSNIENKILSFSILKCVKFDQFNCFSLLHKSASHLDGTEMPQWKISFKTEKQRNLIKILSTVPLIGTFSLKYWISLCLNYLV